jgi:hypothetical protein
MVLSEKITIRATPYLKNELKRLAQLQGITTGRLIRNWISIFLNNQVLNSGKHVYETENGKQFRNMKELCEKLNISSHTARKRIKRGLINKVTIDNNQAKKYGDEVSTTRNTRTEEIRV